MPYAVFSKRTGIISRIVDDLDSLLDSESILEMDEDTNFQRQYPSLIEGQDINTLGFPLFKDENGNTTFKPQRVAYDGVTNRPRTVSNLPVYVAPVNVALDPLTQWTNLSIASHPFAWTVSEAAAVKYESILARNAPFNVIVGEEFINTDHIDTAASSGYVLSEGQLWLAPGGVFVSEEFRFWVNTTGQLDISAGADTRDAQQFVFDTYWFSPEPDDPPTGVEFYWKGREWDGDALITTPVEWHSMVLNDSTATTELDGLATTATVLSGIIIKITNDSGVSLNLENYMLMLRIRNIPTP